MPKYFLLLVVAMCYGATSPPVAAHSCSTPQIQPSWFSKPTVMPYRSEFSRHELRWRVKFRVNSIGVIQGLASYDESGQADAGHTTLFVDAIGRIVVRRQDSNNNYLTRTRTKVVPGRYYDLLLMSSQSAGTRLILDGVVAASTKVGFGTVGLQRPLVLGASCVSCKAGTSTPLKDILDGKMTFAVEDSAGNTISATGTQPNSTPTTAPTQEPPDVSVSLRTDDDWVNPGAVTKLHWTSNGANDCVATGAWKGQLPLNGTRTTARLQGHTTFGVRCSNETNHAIGLSAISVRQAELEWLPPTLNEDGSVLTDLVGYKVHWGTASGKYSSGFTIREPEQTRQNIPLAPGNYFFGLTAYNSRGIHSSISNEQLIQIE